VGLCGWGVGGGGGGVGGGGGGCNPVRDVVTPIAGISEELIILLFISI